MFVSVIVPNYNHAKFLDQRIQSILNQTYQEFELIILDDCSPDEGASRKVIEQYRDNPHVSHIVYNEVNSGSTFQQWNKGITLAKGELIWIAESDDFCDTNLLEELVSEFQQDDNLSLAYSLSKKVDANGKIIPYWCYSPSHNTHLSGVDYIRRYMTIHNHCKNASACVFRKRSYYEIDKTFATYKAGGDKLFWIEIAEHGNVAIVNKRLNYFRQHLQKVTIKSVKNGVNTYEAKQTFNYICKHIQIGQKRRQFCLEHEHYKILNLPFKSESLRRELLEYWEFNNSFSVWKKIEMKLYDILCHRLDIHL